MKVEIEIPDGYMVDKDSSTSEYIMLKKVSVPLSWGEYCRQMGDTYGYSAGNGGGLVVRKPGAYDVFSTPETAKAFNALGKLMQLYSEWIGDWKPEPSPEGDDIWFGIYKYRSSIYCWEASKIDTSFLFPDLKTAINFLDTFKPLFEEAKKIF